VAEGRNGFRTRLRENLIYISQCECDEKGTDMTHPIWKALAVAAALAAPQALLGQEAASYKETKLGLYATATEAYALMQANDRAILIDVRDPVEVMFTGWATETDLHLPWVTADPNRFDAARGTYRLNKNQNFTNTVESALWDLGVSEDDPIIVMCRSGSTRSAPAADVIASLGYTQVYSMTDGFEGTTLKEGESKGVRAVNGWRNSGLPWSYKIPPETAWVAGD
jgi:rhodanese-related sulfurtransferase